MLKQSQTSTGRAAIVQAILAFRDGHADAARTLPRAIRHERGWEQLLARVEETLAEWPIPRLQRPYEPFLYSFDWGWAEAGGWSVRAYRTTGRAIRLYPGIGDALTALGPLLRPFITRWWTGAVVRLRRRHLPAQPLTLTGPYSNSQDPVNFCISVSRHPFLVVVCCDHVALAQGRIHGSRPIESSES